MLNFVTKCLVAAVVVRLEVVAAKVDVSGSQVIHERLLVAHFRLVRTEHATEPAPVHPRLDLNDFRLAIFVFLIIFQMICRVIVHVHLVLCVKMCPDAVGIPENVIRSDLARVKSEVDDVIQRRKIVANLNIVFARDVVNKLALAA